jgi:hypothetical protein
MQPFGYREAPLQQQMAEKFGAEIAAGQGDLLRQRIVQEKTNFIGQSHPIQDIPYFGEPIHFTTTTTAILAGATLNFALLTVRKHYAGFIRTIQTRIDTVGGEFDLVVSVLINGQVVQGLFDVPMGSFMNFSHNTYVRLFQGQVVTLQVRNDGVGPHDFNINLLGWQYALSLAEETARGVIPNE